MLEPEGVVNAQPFPSESVRYLGMDKPREVSPGVYEITLHFERLVSPEN